MHVRAAQTAMLVVLDGGGNVLVVPRVAGPGRGGVPVRGWGLPTPEQVPGVPREQLKRFLAFLDPNWGDAAVNVYLWTTDRRPRIAGPHRWTPLADPDEVSFETKNILDRLRGSGDDPSHMAAVRMGLRLQPQDRPGPTELSGLSTALLLFDKKGSVMTLRRRDTGCWTFPGGNVRAGQSVRQAASQLLYEETGLKVKPVAWKYLYISRQGGLFFAMWIKLPRRPKIQPLNSRSDAVNWSQPHDILQPIEPYVRDVVQQISGATWNLAPVGQR